MLHSRQKTVCEPQKPGTPELRARAKLLSSALKKLVESLNQPGLLLWHVSGFSLAGAPFHVSDTQWPPTNYNTHLFVGGDEDWIVRTVMTKISSCSDYLEVDNDFEGFFELKPRHFECISCKSDLSTLRWCETSESYRMQKKSRISSV